MRLAIGLVLALAVNFGLFALMQRMIAADSIERRVTEDVRLLDFVRLKREDRTEIKKRELPKKPPPPEQPPPPKTPTMQVDKPKIAAPKMVTPNIDIPLNITGGPYLGDFSANVSVPVAAQAPSLEPTIDDDIVPLVIIPPKYPRAASRRGIEGVVTVSFTITKDGQVRDPVVISATPENIFDKEALAAIVKWKFKPKVIDGQPVERQARQEVIFTLTK